MPNKLFDDNSGDEANKDDKLAINKNYADKYGKWRQKEDYERLKAKYGVKDFDSENSDSEESDDEEYVEPDNPEFDMDFYRVLSAVRLKHPILEEKKKFFKDSYQSKPKRKEEKPLSVVDYERKRLLEKTGNGDDDDFVKPGPSGLVKENNFLVNSKEKFKFDDNLSDGDDDDDLFTKKESDDNSTEVEKTDNEAVEFLKGKKKELNNKLDEELLSSLKKDWQTNMSKEDKFLMDYFVNKRYLEEEDETKERADNHYILDFEPLEDDEDTYSKMEEYETKYRFRFEEPDQEFIHRHPRVIEDTLRIKDKKRKEEREKKKNKLKEEEERKKQELLRLRALKKQEIIERIEMLKEVAGIENDLDPDKLDLEADFDPARHDALMSQVFDDNYYNEEGETEKPKFEDEELQRELEEEYEKLKQLDNMAEGTFKYAEVVPNSYGLQTEEILFAKDTELNRWCSINRILKYGQRENEEKRIKINFDHRASNDQIKHKILPSLYSDNIEEHWEAEEERRRKRNLKKKERKKRKLLIKEEEEEATTNSSKIEAECHDTSKLENISDSNGEENDDFGSEKLNKTDSNVGETENKHSSLKNNDELSGDVSSKEDTKLSKKKKKKRKKKNQKLDDSCTTIEECSEGETETKHTDDDSQYSEENSIEINNKKLEEKDESLHETMENTLKKKVKRKMNFDSKEQIENSALNSKNIKVNGSTENNFDKFSEPNYKGRGEQTNSVQSATKNKKKRKLSMNDNENKNKSNKKRKLPKNKFEKGNQLQGISDERLLAYGQNPKKIRKSLKYSTKFKSI